MIAQDESRSTAPCKALLAAEFGRAAVEFASLGPTAPLLARAPRGDGHDVMVLPGFACSQVSTYPLRRFLSWLGYNVHDWGFGRNLGPRSVGPRGERLAGALDELSDHGARPISLVGHSLGGVLARLYALRHPQVVRQVICLGSPFVADPDMVNTTVANLYKRWTGDPEGPPSSQLFDAPKVPCTAIFSRTDGVVAPANCTEAPSPRAENIEVHASHIGLIAHPAVFYAVADRLAQAPDAWRPFETAGWRRLVYGSPFRLARAA